MKKLEVESHIANLRKVGVQMGAVDDAISSKRSAEQVETLFYIAKDLLDNALSALQEDFYSDEQ